MKHYLLILLALLCIAAGPTDPCGPSRITVTYPDGEVACADNAWTSNGYTVTYSEYNGEYWNGKAWVAHPGDAAMSYNGVPFVAQENATATPWDQMGWYEDTGLHVRLVQVTTSGGAR